MFKDMYSTDKIRLRAIKEDDVEFLYKNYNDPPIKEMVFDASPFPLTYDEEISFIQSQKGFGNPSSYAFTIESVDEENSMIGVCGYNKIEWKNRNAEIGIWLAQEYWGKGYGTHTLQLLAKFAFDELNLHKLSLYYFSFNSRGRACYDKVGFKEEGILKEVLYRNGQYHDKIMMGLFNPREIQD